MKLSFGGKKTRSVLYGIVLSNSWFHNEVQRFADRDCARLVVVQPVLWARAIG